MIDGENRGASDLDVLGQEYLSGLLNNDFKMAEKLFTVEHDYHAQLIAKLASVDSSSSPPTSYNTIILNQETGRFGTLQIFDAQGNLYDEIFFRQRWGDWYLVLGDYIGEEVPDYTMSPDNSSP